MRASTTVLVCVVINNSSYPTVKNNTVCHAFGNIECRLEGFKIIVCWSKVIYCICLGLSDGRYLTGLASILLLI